MGKHLRDVLGGEQLAAGGHHRWRLSSDVRERVVAHAVACSADGALEGLLALPVRDRARLAELRK
jgi:hypothetical protein